MISDESKFLLNPISAVRQNLQPTAHPTWEETQIVKRPGIGMVTASTNSPSPNLNKNFLVPSTDSKTVTTSGMLQGGPSVEYLKGLAEGKKHSLVFSCYQPPGSLGYRIRSGEKEIMFRDNGKQQVLTINIEVHRVEITGHSDRRQLMNYIKRCNPQPKKVIVVHGESSRCLDFASSIHKQFKIETVSPKNLEVIRIR